MQRSQGACVGLDEAPPAIKDGSVFGGEAEADEFVLCFGNNARCLSGEDAQAHLGIEGLSDQENEGS